MKNFLKKILFFLLGLIIPFCICVYFLIQNDPEIQQVLFRFQKEKLKSNLKIETLFIGDSSLGNAIDAEEFSKLSGQKCVNLALTGLYGYVGSYNLLVKAHKYNRELKNVIVIQTIDMQTRNVSYEGLVRTFNSFDQLSTPGFMGKLKTIKAAFSYVSSLSLFYNSARELHDDYIKQGPKKDLSHTIKGLQVNQIKKEKNRYLKKMKDFCDLNNINMIYVHGPIYGPVLDSSKLYMDNVNLNLNKIEIQLIDTVFSLTKDEVGDSEDHVISSLKKTYTKKYFELIKPYLVAP